ncbi:MAG TPA: hypothetical protein VGQ66_02990 [Candidatus Limnocylindria bacterium]|jgi:hypothetical protein|nr:hypothetical protein [Candidatus Limnocylindria bacterium]
MVDTIRVVVGVLGALLMLGGLVGVMAGAWAEGLWAAVAGGVVLVAVVLERARYRSEAAESSAAEASGPGGGEPTVPAAPFRPTDEVFIDPTTGHRLRVYIDPASGERRYHAEEVRPGG